MEKEDIIAVLAGEQEIDGSLADTIITTLIDSCLDKEAAERLELTESQWSQLVDKFEGQIRHKVRNLR